MKVVLMNPCMTLPKDKDPFFEINPVLGLAYLTAYLAQQGVDVRFMDVMTEGKDTAVEIDSDRKRCGLSEEAIRNYLARERPGIVGVSCMYTAYADDAHALARVIKGFDSAIVVVFGGAHTSAFYERVLQDPNVDVAVRGEGERTLHELVLRVQAGQSYADVAGIAFRTPAGVQTTPARPLIGNLDELPFPARDKLPFETYLASYRLRVNYLMRNRAATLVSSRGCPMDCVYCAVKTIWGRTWRGRSAANVVDEIEWLVKRYHIGEIDFLDDSLGADKRRLGEICDEIIRRKLDIRWTTPNGIAIWCLDKPLVKKMKRAGCYRLTFGLESGNREILKFIGKSYRIDQAKDLIAYCHRIGLWTMGTFIIGFPEETGEMIEDTIRFALESELDFAIFYTATPYPGTPLYERFAALGLPMNAQATAFSGGCDTRYFTRDQLNAMRDEAYRRVLRDRLRRPWRFLRYLRSPEDFGYMWKLGKNLAYPLLRHHGKLSPETFWRRKRSRE